MIAVFHKGKFVDFWHNDKNNTDNWIERTIQANGWEKKDVKICNYEGVDREKPFLFDENQDLIVYEKTSSKITNEEKKIVDIIGLEPKEYAAREVIFTDGNFEKSPRYESSEKIEIDIVKKEQ